MYRLAGRADSPAAPGPLNAADRLPTLHEMLEVLEFSARPSVAAGYSMGSILALRWAAELTEQVHPDATHHLPITDASWCAAQIAGTARVAGGPTW